jgi:hypothetical protein
MEVAELTPVRNDELLEIIHTVQKEPSTDNIVKMFNAVVAAELLVPISLDVDPTIDEKDVYLEKDTTISFELIKAANGDLYYPVFTHGEELKKCSQEKDQHTMKVTFEDLANMILNQGKVVKGFVINPMGENICFTADMIEGMINSMREEDAVKSGQD